jgi:surfactin synthase thioesterase subunit
MKIKKWIAIRGLVRGNGHWGDFPEVLSRMDSEIDLELLEIPGNGTRNTEVTPLNAQEVIAKIKVHSRIVKEGQPFNLMGISLGGMIALKWAELFPSELNQVVVINTSLRQFSPLIRRLQFHQVKNLFRAIKEKAVRKRELIMLEIASNNLVRSKKWINELAHFSKRYPVTYGNFMRQLILASRIRIHSKQFSVPIKILCAKNDHMVNWSCSQVIAEQFGLPLVIHPTAGHDIPLDDPEWVSQKMLD